MKNALIGLLVIVLIGGGVGGTWYYMDMQVKAANERTNAAQNEVTTAQTQITALQTEMKTQADMQQAQEALLTSFDTFALMTGSGRSVNMLETYYDADVVVEGAHAGTNLRNYGLALQKYWKTLASDEGIVATPIKMVQGDWTAVVQLSQKKVLAPLTLSQSGTLVKTPALTQKELVMTLAKWKDGKIVEQYDFPYAGDASKSKILSYIIEMDTIALPQTQTGSTTEMSDVIPASSGTGTQEKIIPATQPRNTGSGEKAPDTM